MTIDADVIVVGGGHNGLVAAAYLARAGLDTLLIEARASTGGCASTVDALGARFNICNCDHIYVRATPIADELDLATHGLTYVDLEPSYLGARWDGGTPWFQFHDVERTLDGLAVTHPHQVDNYRRYVDTLGPVAEFVLEVSTSDPYPHHVARKVAGHRGAGVREMLTWSRRSAVDVLRQFFDDDDLVLPALATGPVVWGVDPTMAGTGLAALSYANKHQVQMGRPIGGSGGLTDAIRRSFEAQGGRVRCATRVASLIVEAGRVRGVRTTDGDEILADTVVTACDPSMVLVDWLDGDLPRRARRLSERWRRRPGHDGYESKIDAVMTEVPVLTAADGLVDGADPTVPTTVLAPSVEALSAAHALAQRGRVAPDPVMLVNTPSRPDPTMQPGPDRHVLSLEVLWTPYDLEGGWAGSPEPERWLERYAELVQPGWLDSVQDWRVMTPVEYESQFSMRRGFTPSYAGSPLDSVLGRGRELTRYRTPIGGLYLCGAGTFPGAGIWGVSGRNVAAVVERDLGRRRRVAALTARLPGRH